MSMKVIITDTASESLWPIYERHLEYSEDYAVNFQREIDGITYRVAKPKDSPQLLDLIQNFWIQGKYYYPTTE